jgi:GxxExxY protein
MNLQDRIQDMVNEIQYSLGHGHSRSVYQTALTIAIQDANLSFEIDKVIPITFRNQFVGTLTADIILDHRMVIMLCGDRTEAIDQCKMYKRLSQLPFGMIILFTPQGPILEPC